MWVTEAGIQVTRADVAKQGNFIIRVWLCGLGAGWCESTFISTTKGSLPQNGIDEVHHELINDGIRTEGTRIES